jgi:hypothetical protein
MIVLLEAHDLQDTELQAADIVRPQHDEPGDAVAPPSASGHPGGQVGSEREAREDERGILGTAGGAGQRRRIGAHIRSQFPPIVLGLPEILEAVHSAHPEAVFLKVAGEALVEISPAPFPRNEQHQRKMAIVHRLVQVQGVLATRSLDIGSGMLGVGECRSRQGQAEEQTANGVAGAEYTVQG